MTIHPALVKLCKAEQALIQAKDLSEIKHIIDIAEAARVYAQAAKLGEGAARYAEEIKLKAQRKAGECLAGLERKPGARTDLTSAQPVRRLSEYREALNDSDVDRGSAQRWQKVAAIPEPQFQEYLESQGRELTTAGLLKEARETRKRAEAIVRCATPAPLDAIGADSFPVLLADPPWRYEFSRSDNRAIENQYPTMSLQEICGLKVCDLAASDSVLFLWATSPKVAEALTVIGAWGFEYTTSMVWVKDKPGMGYWARQQHELLLIAKRGQLPVPAPENRPSSVFSAPRGKHSEKPEVAYALIERMFPGLAKIELFAREARKGWVSWGNQVKAA